MKEGILLSPMLFLAKVSAHGDKQGTHHQNQGLVQGLDQALIASIGMLMIGLATLAISIKKYRETS